MSCAVETANVRKYFAMWDNSGYSQHTESGVEGCLFFFFMMVVFKASVCPKTNKQKEWNKLRKLMVQGRETIVP